MLQVMHFTMLFLALHHSLIASDEECSFSIDDCSYWINLHQDPKCKQQKTDFVVSSVPVSSRNKRSTMTEAEGQQNIELDKLRRRMIKLERKLSKSIDDLSTHVKRSIRRLEKRLDDSLPASPEKRDVRIKGVSSSTCPRGFEFLDNWSSCYMLSKFNATWYEAKEYCAALNSELIALGTIKEYNLITFLIKNSPDYSPIFAWWTGGTFLAKTKQWIWTSDIYLRPFTFIKWAKDEPNETMSQCVYLNGKDDHMWHDDPCFQRHHFICEINSQSV